MQVEGPVGLEKFKNCYGGNRGRSARIFLSLQQGVDLAAELGNAVVLIQDFRMRFSESRGDDSYRVLVVNFKGKGRQIQVRAED